MAKFASKATTRALKAGPVATTDKTTITYQGAKAFTRDVLSELFVFAASNMVGEDTFYEKAGPRDERFRTLVHQATAMDPDWVARFVPYLRNEMNMRSASIVMAVESALARLGRVKGLTVDAPAGEVTPIRQLINSAITRADEPGELLAYWWHRTGQKSVPGGVQRGLGDAVVRLYTERNALKYDGVNNLIRFADVITFAKPDVDAAWQQQLFDFLADTRWKRDEIRVGDKLTMLKLRRAIEQQPINERRAMLLKFPDNMAKAGYTWESLSTLGPMDKAAWEAMIPSMGIMALIRNLRNFDEAGVSDEVAKTVIDKLTDPEVIAKSRQFPYRFLSAYHAAPSLRWAYPLERAIQLSAQNVPELPGKTLVLCDTSGSMSTPVSARSKVQYADVAALIAGTIAAKQGAGSVDLYGFADGVFYHGVNPNEGILKTVAGFQARNGEVGHGTQLVNAAQRTLTSEHKRVVIVSDMQTVGLRGWGYHSKTVGEVIPQDVPIFALNMVGYAPAAVDAGKPNRFEVGGFSDKLFTMFGLLSTNRGSTWPF